MAIDSVLEASRAGMTFERLRLDVASRNIAAANVPLPPNATATRREVPASAFSAQLGNGDFSTTQSPMATRLVHEPGNPMADAKGMVRYPATDMVGEMTTLVTASRGYEANVRAFNLLRGMVLRALEIGAK